MTEKLLTGTLSLNTTNQPKPGRVDSNGYTYFYGELKKTFLNCQLMAHICFPGHAKHTSNELRHEKTCLATRSDTNPPAQLQKPVRVMKLEK